MVKRRTKKKRKDYRSTVFLSVIALFVLYMAISNIRIFVQRMQVDEELEELEQTRDSLESKKIQLTSLLDRTLSESFSEKVAREELSLKKPGEKVIVIKKEEEEEFTNTQESNNILDDIKDWFSDVFK